MGLLAELGVKPADVNLDDVDKKMASGDLPPEGIHHAMLASVGPIPNADGRGWKFTFEIVAGPGRGSMVEEVLWKPKGENEKKDATMRNRILMFAHRLGLLKKVTGGDGKDMTVEVEGKHDFCDCLGATTFIELMHEEREYEDEKSKTKKKIKQAKVTFGGLLGADDKKVKGAKPAVAGKETVSEAAGKASAGAAAKPKDNFEGF